MCLGLTNMFEDLLHFLESRDMVIIFADEVNGIIYARDPRDACYQIRVENENIFLSLGYSAKRGISWSSYTTKLTNVEDFDKIISNK